MFVWYMCSFCYFRLGIHSMYQSDMRKCGNVCCRLSADNEIKCVIIIFFHNLSTAGRAILQEVRQSRAPAIQHNTICVCFWHVAPLQFSFGSARGARGDLKKEWMIFFSWYDNGQLFLLMNDADKITDRIKNVFFQLEMKVLSCSLYKPKGVQQLW